MGLTAACLLAQGRRRKRNPGAGRVGPQHQAQAHEPQRRGESGSQRQQRSGSLPALAPPVPEASISARDPRGHAFGSPCLSAPSDKRCSRWTPACLCCLTTRCLPWMAPAWHQAGLLPGRGRGSRGGGHQAAESVCSELPVLHPLIKDAQRDEPGAGCQWAGMGEGKRGKKNLPGRGQGRQACTLQPFSSHTHTAHASLPSSFEMLMSFRRS